MARRRGRIRERSWRSLAVGLCSTLGLLLGPGAPSLRAEDRPLGAAEVKAGYLFNFARFVEWPLASLPDDASVFVIGVVGDDEFGAFLERSLSGKTVKRHGVVVRRLARDGDWGSCHILVVGASLGNHLADVAQRLAGRSVLTVSDITRFSETGGMIGLQRDGGRLRLEINRGNAERAGLQISSRLLALAKVVGDDRDRGK